MIPSTQQIIGRINPAVAKDLLKRGFKVQTRAKLLLSGTSGHPRRVDTGQLRSSISVQLRNVGNLPAVRIGTNVRHGKWVHDGTGIYGPRRQLIRARKNKGVLVFTPKGGKRRVFARYVRGMKPNHYLKDALPAARK